MITRNNAAKNYFKKKKKKKEKEKMIIITLETYFPARPLKKRYFHHCH